MTLSETPPEGLLDWIKAQDLQWRDYFIYRAGWQTDPLTGAAAQVRGRRMLGVRGDGEALVCAGRRLRARGIQRAVRISASSERGRARKRRQARLPDVR